MPMSTTVHAACRADEDRTRNSGNATNAIRPRPHARIEAPTNCGTRSTGILLLPSAIPALLKLGYFFGDTAELPLIQQLAIDHSYDQLLHRTAAEPVDDLLNRGYSQVRRRFGNAIYIRAALHAMPDVTFLLQPLENGARRRILHGMALGHGFANVLGGALRALPQLLHHQMLQSG